MATDEVPGHNPANQDKLHIGCWAEHEDGSLLYVEGMESGNVIYLIIDPTPPAMQYRHALPEPTFKVRYSWDPTKPKADKWTWHDKTAFPWDRVMKLSKGEEFVDAEEQLSAARRVADSLKLKGEKLLEEKPAATNQPDAMAILLQMKRALAALPE
jgi:hypothetical protein